MTSLFAAQYIRMSTDKQDLSPSVQKEAIAAYAAARGMEIVASYEDEGRSGVHLKNRPALLRLLHDVTRVQAVRDRACLRREPVGALPGHGRRRVLRVPLPAARGRGDLRRRDVRRGGEPDHCHAQEHEAGNGRRVQPRPCQQGQGGPAPGGLPRLSDGAAAALGYRRCSVSADGQRRVILDNGQRKLAATDRVEWVLAAHEEVGLVRRICELYTRTRLSFNDIARLGSAEGWRDHQGRR